MRGNDAVLVIDETGVVKDLVSLADAGDNIESYKGILSPGFINCHCHLELSHMKGLIPEQTGLVDFVFHVITQRHFPDAEILEHITRAEDEMLQNGIVAVGDICNNTLTILQKQLQRLAYYNFIEVSGWLPALAEQRFQRSFGYYQEFKNLNACNPRSLSPHAPYSVSEELWHLLQPHFNNKTITIHNQETAFEDELFEKGSGGFSRMYEIMQLDTSFFKPTGKTSLQSYYSQLSNARQVLLVHNTFTKKPDLLFAKSQAIANRQTLFHCLCINANRYIENSIPPVQLLRDCDCTIVVGTDSLASNHSLNILAELQSITKYFPQVPLNELLRWATLNGAKALQMEDELGSFAKGKRPGVVLLEGSDGKINEATTVRRIL
ncbi:cytosine/adenosine deaminase-related metal-dependent hydrolase [Sediminibacterium magnilacihabitans]|jgi:cytosine/adenosine deaminase-related metal-dependent hydrolase|nr:cytosine/adenosine deaminase-related metal-dependent hydrolase [Sediminibacterium magnilacihabitans]